MIPDVREILPALCFVAFIVTGFAIGIALELRRSKKETRGSGSVEE